jgi:hypothetical protein
MARFGQSSELVSLDPARRSQAGALLGRAFHTDVLYESVIPDDSKRAALLTWLFDKVVHYALLYGHVETTPVLEGVACWLPPGPTEITLGRILRSGLHATPLNWKPAAGAHTAQSRCRGDSVLPGDGIGEERPLLREVRVPSGE